MIIIGIDAHKDTHTAVAVDEVGKQLAEITVAARDDGHLRLLRWARRFEQRRFAVEDCRHLTRRLEGALLTAGEGVVRVPPHLMARVRASSRQLGKSDPIDALSVARAAQREPDLPVAELDGPTREIKLLADYRDALVRERTRLQNSLRWHLHELCPELEVRARGLKSFVVCRRVAGEFARHEGLVSELAGEHLDRIVDLNYKINDLERRLRPLVTAIAPTLLSLPGLGVLTAAKLVGETARASRFRNQDAYARFNGTAPIPVWSGNTTKVRLARSGNRQVNHALHIMALTQLRGVGPGQGYVKRRMEAGDDRRAALRTLRRKLSNVVFRAMLVDERARETNAMDDDLAAAA